MDLLDGDLCKNLSYFHILSFHVFNHDFIIYIDFTCIAASNAATATDDVTNEVTHRYFILRSDRATATGTRSPGTVHRQSR